MTLRHAPHLLFAMALAVGTAACDDDEPSDDSGGSTNAECTFVTEADLMSVASIGTSRVPRDPSKGAGSTCNGNFAVVSGADFDMVLLIDSLESRQQFDTPSELTTDVYPVLETPTDLGVEAKLLMTNQPDTGAKVLYLWKGDRGYQIISFFKLPSETTPQLTKAQILAIGKIAATRI